MCPSLLIRKPMDGEITTNRSFARATSRWTRTVALSAAVGCAMSAAVIVLSVVLIPVDACLVGADIGYEDTGETEWIITRFSAPSKLFIRSTRRQPPSSDGGFAIPVHNCSSLVPNWSDLHQPSADFQNRQVGLETRIVEARGFPFICCWMEYALHGNGSLEAFGGVLTPFRVDYDPVDPWPLNAAVPLRPLWGQMLLNVVFWSVTSALGVRVYRRIRAAMRDHRRKVRESRGICGYCGHAIAPGCRKICPECGLEYSSSSSPILRK
jgi:hypothetical protein